MSSAIAAVDAAFPRHGEVMITEYPLSRFSFDAMFCDAMPRDIMRRDDSVYDWDDVTM